MSKPSTQEAIHDFWLSQLECGEMALSTRGVSVVAHGQEFRDYKGAFCFRYRDSCAISVPDQLVKIVSGAVAGMGIDEAFNEKTLRAIFADRVDRVIGPAYYGYADESDLIQSRNLECARLLLNEDLKIVSAFNQSLDGEDWALSGLQLTTPVLFGSFEGSELVALAGYEVLHKRVAHIGIVTNPLWRGLGHGKSVLASLAMYGVRQGLILQYRTLRSNIPSVVAATSLGFHDFGSSIAIRFR